MNQDYMQLSEEYIKLAFAIEEYTPGYIDAYFGPVEWKEQAKQEGKLPLQNLTERTAQLAKNIAHADMDLQRKDFLARQIYAMQMSLRLLGGEQVSLSEETQALYDIQPNWKDETIVEEGHKELDSLLPPGESLSKRMQDWNSSLEIPIEKVKELLPIIIKRLRELTIKKFDLPRNESFALKFVSDQPWGAYNWYLGNFQSRIDLNTDLPSRVTGLPDLLAHEGYPGHHTELSIKEEKLVKQKQYHELTINLINSPSCLIAEGIATTALNTVLTDNELEDWYREEILPLAGLAHIDAKRLMSIGNAREKIFGISGNAAFMMYDQKKGEDEISLYLQEYNLSTEKQARQNIKFISNPLYRSYIFTYHVGRDLFEELFSRGNRDAYFKRILEEPVTPSQIRAWLADSESDSN